MKRPERLRSLGFVLGIGAVLSIAAHPVAAASKKPPSGKVFGDWGVICESPDNGKTEKCFITQTQDMKDKGRLLQTSIGYLGPNNEPIIIAKLPLGIYIPGGAAYKVGQEAQVSMVIQRCTNDGCVAVGPLPEAVLKAMNAGSEAVIGVMPAVNAKTVTIALSTKGFKEAFASLK